MPAQAPVSWDQLLSDAVEKPGTLNAAFHAFHGYSIGNQMLALWQCMARGIEPGPIASYKAWQGKGRNVAKGQKAIVLCMPVTIKKQDEKTGEEKVGVWFKYAPNWFVLSQTEGDTEVELPATPEWDSARMLETLKITRKQFDLMDGNIGGYAIPNEKTIAINPAYNDIPGAVIHETAHCLLHAGEDRIVDGMTLDRNIREVEAEATTLLVTEALGLPGAEYHRGYIQHWYRDGQPIPEANARRIISAAEKIIRAGQPAKTAREGTESDS